MDTLINETGRTCTGCKEFLEWNHYWKNPKKKSGHEAKCAKCRKTPTTKIKGFVNDKGRECTVCKKFLTWENFSKGNAVNNKRSYCKSCVKITTKRFQGKLEKPLNPNTGKLYVRGEEIGDKYFHGYKPDKKHSLSYKGKYKEIFAYDLEETIRLKARELINARNAYVRSGRLKSHSLTIEHLIDIFPRDLMCPILNIKMTLVANKRNSIELDRNDISKPYEDGNVTFISQQANRSKSDSSSAELYKIADWLSSKGL